MHNKEWLEVVDEDEAEEYQDAVALNNAMASLHQQPLDASALDDAGLDDDAGELDDSYDAAALAGAREYGDIAASNYGVGVDPADNYGAGLGAGLGAYAGLAPADDSLQSGMYGGASYYGGAMRGAASPGGESADNSGDYGEHGLGGYDAASAPSGYGLRGYNGGYNDTGFEADGDYGEDDRRALRGGRSYGGEPDDDSSGYGGDYGGGYGDYGDRGIRSRYANA